MYCQCNGWAFGAPECMPLANSTPYQAAKKIAIELKKIATDLKNITVELKNIAMNLKKIAIELKKIANSTDVKS